MLIRSEKFAVLLEFFEWIAGLPSSPGVRSP